MYLYYIKYINKINKFHIIKHEKWLTNKNFLFCIDIPDIPDEIRSLRLLQVADFSSNPIPK